jgi:hypothetical protein
MHNAYVRISLLGVVHAHIDTRSSLPIFALGRYSLITRMLNGYVPIFALVYYSVYLLTYIQTYRQTDRQTDRHKYIYMYINIYTSTYTYISICLS